MDPAAYLQHTHDKYQELYRGSIRKLRDEGTNVEPETVVRPDPKTDQAPEPVVLDIVTGPTGDEKGSIVAVYTGPTDGPLVGVMRSGGVDIKVFPLTWDVLRVWIRIPSPEWDRLWAWRKRWVICEVGEVHAPDADGVHNLVHYLSQPKHEGGGYAMELDLGSAPVEALTELLDAFVAMCAVDINLGFSDGTDLPADVYTRASA